MYYAKDSEAVVSGRRMIRVIRALARDIGENISDRRDTEDTLRSMRHAVARLHSGHVDRRPLTIRIL